MDKYVDKDIVKMLASRGNRPLKNVAFIHFMNFIAFPGTEVGCKEMANL